VNVNIHVAAALQGPGLSERLTGYLSAYVNSPRAVMNDEGGFLRWVMGGG
jgi:hypothetical protein